MPKNGQNRKKGNHIEVVTVHNRTSKQLTGVWDGRRYPLEPHTKQAYPVLIAEAFKRQNPVMGSEDPDTGEIQYLVAIEEFGDDLSPIEQTKAITKMNRSAWANQETVVQAKPTGLYEVRQPLPINTDFGKA